MYRVYVDAFSLPEAARMRQMLLAGGEFDVPDIDVNVSGAQRQRRELLNEADFVVLGAPARGERDPLADIENRRVRVLRASGCAVADESWVYGLPELSSSHRRQIAEAVRVTNPGCCAAGAILLLRPLVVSGLLAQTAAVSIFCMAGRSARGAWPGSEADCTGIAADAAGDAGVRGFGHLLDHPYAAEIRRHALLECMPNFVAVRGCFDSGTMMYVPLHTAHMNPALPRRVPRLLVEQALMKYYEGSDVLCVVPGGEEAHAASPEAAVAALRPDAQNGTNGVRLHVFGSHDEERLCLAAVYDNLGKGHCGAVLQNLRIMAGMA